MAQTAELIPSAEFRQSLNSSASSVASPLLRACFYRNIFQNNFKFTICYLILLKFIEAKINLNKARIKAKIILFENLI